MKKRKKSQFIEGDPPHFSHSFTWMLELQLRLLDDVKYLRWYKDKSYLRFKIFDESYKIITSESHQPYDDFREYRDGSWDTCGQYPFYFSGKAWIVNAIRFYNSANDIVQTCIAINNYLHRYDDDEYMDKMLDFAKSQNFDPTTFDYDYIKRDAGFSISHDDEYEEAIDDFTGKFISHLGLKRDKYGALFLVMKVLVQSVFDFAIDEYERSKEA